MSSANTTSSTGLNITAGNNALIPSFGPSQVPAPAPSPVLGPAVPPIQTATPTRLDPFGARIFGAPQPGQAAQPPAPTPPSPESNVQNFGTPNVPTASTTSGTVAAPGSSATDQDLQNLLEVTQAPIPEGGSVVPDAGADIFADSSLAVQQEENVVDELNSLSAPTIETEKLQQVENDMFKLVDDRMAELDSRLNSELSSINAQFDKAKVDQAKAQANETGTTAVGLQRIGGFLGTSASAIGAMNNLAENHRNDVTALEGMRASALQSARNATADQKFDLASVRIQEAKALEQEIYDRRQDFFKNMLTLNQEERTEKEFESGEIQDKLEAFASVAAEGGNLDPQTASQIDQFYGVEGFSTKYADAITAAKEEETAENLLSRQTKLVGLLESIPAGKTITFPDGSEYTGLGASGDVVTSIQKNVQTGDATLITVNKRTGEVSTTGVGNFGVASSGESGGVSSISPEVNEFNSADLPREELRSLASRRAGALKTVGERQAALSNISVIEQANEIYDQLTAVGGPDVGFALDKVREGLTVDILNNQVSLTPSTRNLGLTSEQSDILNSRMTLLTANFIKSISGAQVSDAERQFLLQASTGEGRSEQGNLAALLVMSEAVNRSLGLATQLDTTSLSSILSRDNALAAEAAPTVFETGGASFNIPFGVTSD